MVELSQVPPVVGESVVTLALSGSRLKRQDVLAARFSVFHANLTRAPEFCTMVLVMGPSLLSKRKVADGGPAIFSKVTVAERSWEIFMMQLFPLLPVQPLPQRLIFQPLAGEAERWTEVPLVKLA